MGHSHYEAHSFKTYDSRENEPFRDGLTELIKTAYATALRRAAENGEVRDETQDWAGYETDDGGVMMYDFYARASTGEVMVTAVALRELNELPDIAALAIQADIQTAEVPDNLKKEFDKHPIMAMQLARVDQFTRRQYLIRLPEGDVRVARDTGYKANDYEVAPQIKTEIDEFERQRQTIFDKDDLFEVMNALYAMGLVSSEQVQRFLDKDF